MKKTLTTIFISIITFSSYGITLKTTEDNGFLTIPVKINNRDFKGVIDTGSYPISFFKKDISNLGNNTIKGSSIVLKVGDITEKNVKVDFFPKESSRPNIKGNIVILGGSFLSENKAIINTKNKTITFNESHYNYGDLDKTRLNTDLMKKGAITTYAVYHDKKRKLIVDTGTYPILINNKEYIKGKDSLIFGENNINNLSIQKVDFNRMKKETGIDGIFGLEFMKKLEAIISYPEKSIYTKKEYFKERSH